MITDVKNRKLGLENLPEVLVLAVMCVKKTIDEDRNVFYRLFYTMPKFLYSNLAVR